MLQNIKSETEKLTASFENQVARKNMVIVNYTNASELTVAQADECIIILNYIFESECRPIVICTIPFTIDTDGYMEFTLYDGLIPIINATYKGYYEKGSHFATFMYLDNYERGTRRNLKVLAKAYADTTSTARTQEARIKTLENAWELIQSGASNLEIDDVTADTTEPTATIEGGAIKAIVYANAGGNGVVEWDGVLEFTDRFICVPTFAPSIEQFIDEITSGMQAPEANMFVEMFTSLEVFNIRIDGANNTWGEYINSTWGEHTNKTWDEM